MAEVDSPNAPYLRYQTSGYGLSQAFGTHKRLSTAHAAISIKELDRAMAGDLNSVERNRSKEWQSFYKPFYDGRRAEYLSGSFSPDVQWPVKWFREPEGVTAKQLSATTFEISWRTDSPSDSEVAWTSKESWWPTGLPNWPDGPDGSFRAPQQVTEHKLLIEGLAPATGYRFRIRSSNQKPLAEEVVWGSTGSFSTGRQ
jgi:hypothetical protein